MGMVAGRSAGRAHRPTTAEHAFMGSYSALRVLSSSTPQPTPTARRCWEACFTLPTKGIDPRRVRRSGLPGIISGPACRTGSRERAFLQLALEVERLNWADALAHVEVNHSPEVGECSQAHHAEYEGDAWRAGL